MKFGEIPGIQVEIKKMTWLQEKNWLKNQEIPGNELKLVNSK